MAAVAPVAPHAAAALTFSGVTSFFRAKASGLTPVTEGAMVGRVGWCVRGVVWAACC
jgi:hypothetical protein